jgi:tetratricopeptide (TPR) repeat protein
MHDVLPECAVLGCVLESSTQLYMRPLGMPNRRDSGSPRRGAVAMHGPGSGRCELARAYPRSFPPSSTSARGVLAPCMITLPIVMISRSTSFLHDKGDVVDDPVEKEIKHYRTGLAACPNGHPQRGDACGFLANSLYRRYKETYSTALLDEVIALGREILALRPIGHPDHARSCNNLGTALSERYNITGTTELLDEMITLHHAALAVQPVGHLDRAMSCHNLANALHTRYEITGLTTLLDETIMLRREALDLRPSGHPYRASACNGLANALHARYDVTGNTTLLDELFNLRRETLALQPTGHPDRARYCNNLANALYARYEVTGVVTLLDEMTTLYREALTLRPAGHHDRAHSCNNLANALLARYKVTGSNDLLDETIALYEALALRPVGHPHRADSCNNLATALHRRYEVTNIPALLEETIALYREALSLLPLEHPDHAMFCNNLANELFEHFRKTQHVTVIAEALALAHESAASSSRFGELWIGLLILCNVYTEPNSPYSSVTTATKYLSQASALHPDNIAEFMQSMQGCLTSIWSAESTWTNDTPLLLLSTYSNLIDRLSRMTGFALDTASQLTALRSARSFGSDACIAALMAGNPSQAIELIDRAHGVIWAQALHQRDPQLQDIPQSLACELEALLRAVSLPLAANAIRSSELSNPHLSPEDVRHQQNSRIQTILTEIRAMPQLERFMLGNVYSQLRETASDYPVVVLLSAHGHVYALVIRDSAQENPDRICLNLTSDGLSLLRNTAARVGFRQGGSVQEFERAMHISGRKKVSPLATLANIWQDIVKPVIDHLRLPVRV